MNILKITILAFIMGGSLISCDSNDDSQEVQNTVKEMQATHGEDGDIVAEDEQEGDLN